MPWMSEEVVISLYGWKNVTNRGMIILDPIQCQKQRKGHTGSFPVLFHVLQHLQLLRGQSNVKGLKQKM